MLYFFNRFSPSQNGHHTSKYRIFGESVQSTRTLPSPSRSITNGDGTEVAIILEETGGEFSIYPSPTPFHHVWFADYETNKRWDQRKCWWDGVEVDIPIEDDSTQTANVKVWARRVWTLELSLI
jgi:hypothetical protein